MRTKFVGWPVGLAVLGGGVGLGVGGGVWTTQLCGWVGSHSGSVAEQSAHVLRQVPSLHSGLARLRCQRRLLRWSWFWLLLLVSLLCRSCRRCSDGQPLQSAIDEHCIAGLWLQYPIPGAMGDCVVGADEVGCNVGLPVVGWAVVGPGVGCACVISKSNQSYESKDTYYKKWDSEWLFLPH